ncbi:hypothetical protein pipiens_010571 [Culex pipiens pipiens]|uniref:RNase H type-1 domain-containing protein n=1 Tax=Culex pipiens pipiens TaxID=38569 RepID=A0ABD1DBA0_CULPP
MLAKKKKYKKTVIFTDSKSGCQSLTNSKLLHENFIIWDIYKEIEKAPRGAIKIQWVPSHVGIRGNEAADVAAQGKSYDKQTEFMGITMGDACVVSQKEIWEDWSREYKATSETKGRWHYQLMESPGPKIWSKGLLLSPAQIKLLSRIRSGHTLTKDRRALWRLEDDNLCELCLEVEDLKHSLYYCPKYNNTRSKHHVPVKTTDPAVLKEKAAEELKSAASLKGGGGEETTNTPEAVPIEKDDLLEKIATSSPSKTTASATTTKKTGDGSLAATNDVDMENDDLLQRLEAIEKGEAEESATTTSSSKKDEDKKEDDLSPAEANHQNGLDKPDEDELLEKKMEVDGAVVADDKKEKSSVSDKTTNGSSSADHDTQAASSAKRRRTKSLSRSSEACCRAGKSRRSEVEPVVEASTAVEVSKTPCAKKEAYQCRSGGGGDSPKEVPAAEPEKASTLAKEGDAAEKLENVVDSASETNNTTTTVSALVNNVDAEEVPPAPAADESKVLDDSIECALPTSSSDKIADRLKQQLVLISNGRSTPNATVSSSNVYNSTPIQKQFEISSESPRRMLPKRARNRLPPSSALNTAEETNLYASNARKFNGISSMSGSELDDKSCRADASKCDDHCSLDHNDNHRRQQA